METQEKLNTYFDNIRSMGKMSFEDFCSSPFSHIPTDSLYSLSFRFGGDGDLDQLVTGPVDLEIRCPVSSDVGLTWKIVDAEADIDLEKEIDDLEHGDLSRCDFDDNINVTGGIVTIGGREKFVEYTNELVLPKTIQLNASSSVLMEPRAIGVTTDSLNSAIGDLKSELSPKQGVTWSTNYRFDRLSKIRLRARYGHSHAWLLNKVGPGWLLPPDCQLNLRQSIVIYSGPGHGKTYFYDCLTDREKTFFVDTDDIYDVSLIKRRFVLTNRVDLLDVARFSLVHLPSEKFWMDNVRKKCHVDDVTLRFWYLDLLKKVNQLKNCKLVVLDRHVSDWLCAEEICGFGH